MVGIAEIENEPLRRVGVLRRRHGSTIASRSSLTPSPVLPDTPRTVIRRREQERELGLDVVDARVRRIYLGDDGNDDAVRFFRDREHGERLRLDALRRIDEQDNAFDGRQRARDFIREIHVPGRIDEIQYDSARPLYFHCIRTGCILMVMPRSRSRSILSSTCSCMRRGSIVPRRMQEQVLDKMDLERERGITIKMAAGAHAVEIQGRPSDYRYA